MCDVPSASTAAAPPPAVDERADDPADLFEHVGVGLRWVGPDGVILRVNQAELDLFGYAREEYVGHNIAGFHADPEERADILARLARGEPLRDYPAQMRHRDGTLRRVLISSDVRRRDGVVLYSRCVTLDITGRVRMEEALRESERRYRELFENAADILYTLDLEGNLTAINRAAEAVTGYRREELVGRPIAAFVDPAYHARMREMLARKSGGEESTTYELEVRARDGRRLTLEVTSRLIKRDGQPVGIQGSARDITALRETADARDRALAEARAALRARDDFLAMLSHDLRTPLTAIRGRAQYGQLQAARAPSLASDRVAAWLADIDRSAARISGMIEDLLDLARLETGRPLELRRSPVDLVALARRLAEEQQRGTDRHRIRVEAAVPVLVGSWDPERLERVLVNLLSNAVKYSAQGDVVVRVGTVGGGAGTAATDGGLCAVIVVEDRGLGIPAADLPHIFERFYRGRNVAGRVSGVGLGLAGAKQIVEQHGGTIAVRSTEGVGTTVTIRLPLDGGAAPAPEESAGSEPALPDGRTDVAGAAGKGG
jgi:PAS domain S-box-containing protein